MNTPDTLMHPCGGPCARETEHVHKTKYEKRRSHEPAKPGRAVLQCINCGWVTETLPSRGVRP